MCNADRIEEPCKFSSALYRFSALAKQFVLERTRDTAEQSRARGLSLRGPGGLGSRPGME